MRPSSPLDEVVSKEDVLVVELVEILHVAEDDVFFVDDSRRDFLHAAAHLPQVRLVKHNTTAHSGQLGLRIRFNSQPGK